MVSGPRWSKLMLCCLIIFVVGGVVSLGIAIYDCARLYHLIDAGMTPANQPSLLTMTSETWLSLMVGAIALFGAIWLWTIRKLGLLIRKLGNDQEPNRAETTD